MSSSDPPVDELTIRVGELSISIRQRGGSGASSSEVPAVPLAGLRAAGGPRTEETASGSGESDESWSP